VVRRGINVSLLTYGQVGWRRAQRQPAACPAGRFWCPTAWRPGCVHTFTSGHLPPSCSDGQRENAYAGRLRQLPDTAGHLAARRQRAGADHGELWRRVPVPGACGAAALQPSLPGQTAAPAVTPAGRCPLRRRR
jgi:hypothetical protein